MFDLTLFTEGNSDERMAEYLSKVGNLLGNKRRQASFSIYAMGLMGEGERKSAEPIAARACVDPALVDAYHQRLTYFLSESGWSDDPVRRFAARYALEEITRREQIATWVIDETAFPKQGTHSVGVKRQCTGTGWKPANCQIGVSLSVASRSEHLPLDFELYLPKCWSDNPFRRIEANIPDGVRFQTKPELAMQMIRRALQHGVPMGVVLADPTYGDSNTFRRELREHGLDYAAGVDATTMVWSVAKSGERVGPALSVRDLGHTMKAQFRKVDLGGTGGETTASRFATCRVRPVDCVTGGADDEELWLLSEMPTGEDAPCAFWLVTLPRRATKEQLVSLVKERCRTAEAHKDLKVKLGLDHFEGRTYRGWHHHVTVALVCFAFIVAERSRGSTLLSQRPSDYQSSPEQTSPNRPLPQQSSGQLHNST